MCTQVCVHSSTNTHTCIIIGDGCSRDLYRERRRRCGAGGRERRVVSRAIRIFHVRKWAGWWGGGKNTHFSRAEVGGVMGRMEKYEFFTCGSGRGDGAEGKIWREKYFSLRPISLRPITPPTSAREKFVWLARLNVNRVVLCSTACRTSSVTSATVRGATRTASVRKDVQTARR